MRRHYLLFVLLVISLLPVIAAAAHAAEPVYSVDASVNKLNYAIGEVVELSVAVTWQFSPVNASAELKLFDSSGKLLYVLKQFTMASENGTFSETYTVTDLTKSSGTHEYIIKLYVNGLPVAEKVFKVTVVEPQYRLLVALDDASGDRVVDVGELVTFTVYIDWSFVPNQTDAYLYVDEGGSEKLVKQIAITQYSGTAQAQYQTVFNENGVKTVRFVLKDATGKILAEKVVTFNVGEQRTSASTVPLDSSTLKYVAIAALLLAAVYIVARRK